MSLRQRRTKLLKEIEKLGCNTAVVFEPENIFYLTGFWGEASAVIENKASPSGSKKSSNYSPKATIIAPELEVGRAEDESKDCQVIKSQRGKGSIANIASFVERSNSKKKKPQNHSIEQSSGVCTDTNNYDTIEILRRHLGMVLPSSEPFLSTRQIKDAQEVSILKKASKIIDEMFEICSSSIKPGMSESQLQTILMSYAFEKEMFPTGYRSNLHPLIIAGGPNGAQPHAQVTTRKFKKGDLVVVDLTLRYKGYVSDATRTFGVQTVPKRQQEIYSIVQKAQQLGLKYVKPKTSCKTVDDVCRKEISKHGYGQYFIHSTGHGIGLDVHELPTLSPVNKTGKLEKNMAITVEPGIYIPGKFGVRIEDSAIVASTGPQVMHKFTKDLVVV